jgi:hypothetical protein
MPRTPTQSHTIRSIIRTIGTDTRQFVNSPFGLSLVQPCGLYYKNIMIINDDCLDDRHE